MLFCILLFGIKSPRCMQGAAEYSFAILPTGIKRQIDITLSYVYHEKEK